MKIEKELLLVKLPKIPDIIGEFYGIGYYCDAGFIFMLITEDIINTQPLRRMPFPEDSIYDSSNQIEIIGKIKDLSKPKK